jgi:hypothetical protein
MDPTQLSPELMQQLMALSTLDEEGQGYDEQLAQAQALMQPVGGGHTTGLGAALGGIGDVLRSGIGAYKGSQAHKSKSELLGKKTAGRNAYANLLFGLGGGAQPGMDAGIQPAPPMGYAAPGDDHPQQYGYSPGMWNQGPPYRGGG